MEGGVTSLVSSLSWPLVHQLEPRLVTVQGEELPPEELPGGGGLAGLAGPGEPGLALRVDDRVVAGDHRGVQTAVLQCRGQGGLLDRWPGDQVAR